MYLLHLVVCALAFQARGGRVLSAPADGKEGSSNGTVTDIQAELLKNTSTLLMTTIVFRHGDRVPDSMISYPNNIYRNVSFFPYKNGELTRRGQKTMFETGQALRRRYGSFLGHLFYTDLIKSTTSNYLRCQMSVQALHAGLFATTTSNPIPNWQWQAVPYDILAPFSRDRFISVQGYCPQVYGRIDTTDSMTDATARYVFGILREHSGFESVGYYQALSVYDTTKTSVENGLTLPAWLEPIYPTPLRQVAVEAWRNLQRQVGRIGFGPLLKRIIDDAVAKSEGTLVPEGRKMFLYSGHDMNLYFLLEALGMWPSEEVQYGAALMFELHQIGDQYGFMIFFDNKHRVPRIMRIGQCGYFCPLDKFISLTQHYYDPEPLCPPA